MMENRLRILFTTPVLRHPPKGGPELRIENSIKALAQISDLYICSKVSLNALGGVNGLSFYKQYCKGFYFAPFTNSGNRYIKFAKRVVNFIARRIIKQTIFTTDQESERGFQYLLKIADELNVDLIWLGYGNISYPLLKYIKRHSNYKLVVDTDSVWSRFVLRGVTFAEDDKERQKIEKAGKEKEEEERWGTELAEVTTAVSEIDAEYYRQFTEDKEKIKIFSNVIDINNYKKQTEPTNFKKPSLYIAGSFFSETCPMMKGTIWFLQNVFSIVKKQIPDIHLYIIGNGSDKMLSGVKDNQITITGMLDSVLPYLTNVDISLVPLFFESGTRFKILEAGATGIPIVSTTLGAEGIPVTHGKDIMIADDPDSFAKCIVKLIDDKSYANKLAVNCRKLVQERYSIENLSKEGNEIINYFTLME